MREIIGAGWWSLHLSQLPAAILGKPDILMPQYKRKAGHRVSSATSSGGLGSPSLTVPSNVPVISASTALPAFLLSSSSRLHLCQPIPWLHSHHLFVSTNRVSTQYVVTWVWTNSRHTRLVELGLTPTYLTTLHFSDHSKEHPSL